MQGGTQTLNSCRRLDYARDDKSIIYVPMIYASQKKNTSILAKGTHLQVIPQQSTKTANLRLRTYENTSGRLYRTARASTLARAIILLTQVPLQKFPFLFIFIIP